MTPLTHIFGTAAQRLDEQKALPCLSDVGKRLTLRFAHDDDCRACYEWRMLDPLSRAMSLYKKIAPYEEYQKVFARNLRDDDQVLFIAEQNGGNVGYLSLYKSSASDDAHAVGYIVSPLFRQQGIGTAIMTAGAALMQDQALIATIQHDNQASQKIVEKAGFSKMAAQPGDNPEFYNYLRPALTPDQKRSTFGSHRLCPRS